VRLITKCSKLETFMFLIDANGKRWILAPLDPDARMIDAGIDAVMDKWGLGSDNQAKEAYQRMVVRAPDAPVELFDQDGVRWVFTSTPKE
jgi:hypothetical protein